MGKKFPTSHSVTGSGVTRWEPTVLFGASKSRGVKYNVIEKWFTECDFLDGRHITDELFIRSYERLCPNREDLSQAQFIQLIGILMRATRQDMEEFMRKFNTVKQVIIEDIMESRRHDDYRYS